MNGDRGVALTDDSRIEVGERMGRIILMNSVVVGFKDQDHKCACLGII